MATIYFRYSEKRSLAVVGFDHHDSERIRSDTTGNGTSVTSGSWWPSSANARRMWKFEVTTITDLNRHFRIHSRVSVALPTVLAASCPMSTQQPNRRS